MARLPIALAVLLLAPAVVPSASASTTQRTAKARVWIANERPAVVRGTGFKPGERVQVSLAAVKQRLRKTVSANAKGVFVARWTTGLKSDCGNKLVTATGSLGTRAVFKVVANDCAPQQDPYG